MAKQFWTFISYLFHPALMPTLAVFIVLQCDPNFYLALDFDKPWLIVLGVTFFCTYFLPVCMSMILLKLGMISSLSMPTDNDRRYILMFTTLFFILAYYCFHNVVSSGASLKVFMLGINVSIIITFITSMFTKVSFHSVGVGGLLGTVIGLMRYTHEYLILWLIGAFAITVLTALSRYKLKAHDAFEIYLGLIIGIGVQALMLFTLHPLS